MREEHELIIYKYADGNLTQEKYADYGDRKEELEEAFRIKVLYKNAKILDVYKLFVLYDDNGLYIYNVKEKQTQKINLSNKYNFYSMHINDDLNQIIGIYYVKNDKYIYYDLIKNKEFPIEVDGFDHLSLEPISEKYFSLRSSKENNSYTFLFNLETGKVDLENNTEFQTGILKYELLKYQDQYMIFLWSRDNFYDGYLKIYNSNLDLIYESSEEHISENYVGFSDGYLYINENGIINKYDMSGVLVSNSKKYDNIKKVISNYVIYLKNNNLLLENINDNNESLVLTKWNNNWKINDTDLKFISQKRYKTYNSSTNESEDICITINYNEKDSDGNYGMKYCYTSDKDLKKNPLNT